MEAERRSRRSVKRKPLSDRTNLLPTTTLRNLSSPLFVKPPNPNPNPKQTPKPNPKPYNSSSTNKKSETNSSKSDTSVGSSNNNASNPRSIRQPTNPGNGNGEIFESLVVYGRRQSVEKTKYNGKEVSVPSSCPPLDKTKDKGKAVAVDFSCPSLLKTKDKGKVVVVPFGHPSVENGKNIGKAATVSFSPQGERKDAGKEVDVPFGYPTTENTKNKGKAVHLPSSCPPPLRIRTIRDKLNDAEDIGLSRSCTTHPKYKRKRHCLPAEEDVSRLALPLDFIEQQRAYFKEIDEFELPEEEVAYDTLDE